MPGLATHVNFARLLLAKQEFDFDLTYLILGSIAPDSVNILNDDKAFRRHHFILTSSLSDLKFYLDLTQKTREKSSLSIRSFLDGYYAHLWLDVFTMTHEDDLRVAGSPGLFKANIERYDMLDIKDFLPELKEPSERLHKIPGLDFIKFNELLALWDRFTASVKEYDFNRVRQIVFTKEAYNIFLNKAVNEFSKDLRKLVQ
jgi:hypothetical protein